MPAPIALFVYNRPEHTRRTVDALRTSALAADSDLFVYSDAPKNVEAAVSVALVRDYVAGIEGFRSVTIFARDENLGVDASVIDGVTMLCERFGDVIVVEDDLVTSASFLDFMNRALVAYADDDRIMHVGGFMYPVEFSEATRAVLLPHMFSWGWATWQRSWRHFDSAGTGYPALARDGAAKDRFDRHGGYPFFEMLTHVVEGRSTAWDVLWYLSVFQRGGISVYPTRSLVQNIGFDGSGVHGVPSDSVTIELTAVAPPIDQLLGVDTAFSHQVDAFLRARFGTGRLSLIHRIARRIRREYRSAGSKLTPKARSAPV